MNEIRYLTGDATDPVGDGPMVIAHVCNDQGGWERGFVVALSRRWPEPEEFYRMWADMPDPLPDFAAGGEGAFALGNVQYVPVDGDLVVANMVAQRGIRHDMSSPPAIDYKALRFCFRKLGEKALAWYESAGTLPTIHMPRIGCGLGGGKWETVEECILESLVDVYGLTVTVYDLPE